MAGDVTLQSRTINGLSRLGLRAVTMLGAGFIPDAAHAQALDDDYINADRPGIADGSYVVGGGRFEIETAIQWEYHENDPGHDRRLFVPTLLRLGIDSRWEIRVEGNSYSRTVSHGPGRDVSESDGLAPTSVGFKYHFIDSEGTQRPSLATIVRVFPPSGSGDFRTHHTTGDVRLAADWDLSSKWSINPNVGIARYEDDSGRAFVAGLAAATLNYNPSKVLNFFVDTGLQAPESKHGRASLIVDAGTAYIIGRDIQLDLSAGLGAAGAAPPKAFIAAGFSKRF